MSNFDKAQAEEWLAKVKALKDSLNDLSEEIRKEHWLYIAGQLNSAWIILDETVYILEDKLGYHDAEDEDD